MMQGEVTDEEEEEGKEAFLDDRKNFILHSEGFKVTEVELKYINKQEEAMLADIICLLKWRDTVLPKRAVREKQSSIKDISEN